MHTIYIAFCLGILLHLGLSYYIFKVRICIHIAAPSNRLRSRPLHNTKRWCPDFGISLKSTALFLSIKSGYTCASCLITGMWTSSLVLASGHSTGVIFCFHVLETYVRKNEIGGSLQTKLLCFLSSQPSVSFNN